MGTIEWACVAVYLVCAVLTAATVSTKNPDKYGMICCLGFLWWFVLGVLLVAVVASSGFWNALFAPITWLGRTRLCVRLNEIVEKIDIG